MPAVGMSHKRGYEAIVFLVLTLPRISLLCVGGGEVK